MGTIKLKLDVAKLKNGAAKHTDMYRKASMRASRRMGEDMKKLATSNLESSVRYGTGGLASSIRYRYKEQKGGRVTVSLYSNSDHSDYRELGTGRVGAQSVRMEVKHAYGSVAYTSKDVWVFPTDMDFGVLYGMVSWQSKDGQWFARTHGQKSRPYLFPAYKQVSQKAKQYLSDEFRNVKG
ncbi:HK97 gp10 family phage protein [Periweissella cryptocerci]|nr:HK97 gp10 family phage protein [Periweissella cryptocerci]